MTTEILGNMLYRGHELVREIRVYVYKYTCIYVYMYI